MRFIRAAIELQWLTCASVLQGGEPDYEACSKMVINDWQRGKLPFFVPPPGSKGEEEAAEVTEVIIDEDGAQLPGIDVHLPESRSDDDDDDAADVDADADGVGTVLTSLPSDDDSSDADQAHINDSDTDDEVPAVLKVPYAPISRKASLKRKREKASAAAAAGKTAKPLKRSAPAKAAKADDADAWAEFDVGE